MVLATNNPPSDLLDLAIIGAGPAALTAAIYAARAGISTTVFERTAIGGALAEISHIANFPGFDGSGPELAKMMRPKLRLPALTLPMANVATFGKLPTILASRLMVNPASPAPS